MGEYEKKGNRSFVRERIVPRKNFRKILIPVLSAIGLGIVFGITAGITIVLSDRLTEDKTETQREQIIIVRDESSSESESESAEADTEAVQESTEETAEPPESAVPETVSEQTILKEAYAELEKGLVTVIVTEAGGTDWFDIEITKQTEQFGVAVAKTSGTMYLLTPGSLLAEGMSVEVEYQDSSMQGTVVGVDSRTGLGIVAVRGSWRDLGLSAVTLGNSYGVSSMDRVYLAGQPLGVTGAVEAGFVTNVLSPVDVTDGYEQLIYTDLPRTDGGYGVLFNEKGQIVGWVSDYMGDPDSRTAVACGISPLKYLIEDLCSGEATAYLGVLCTSVSRSEAERTGITPGLYVREVEAGSPAYASGIQVGDRLISLNGRTLADGHSLRLRMDELTPGDEVVVESGRRSSEGEETLTLWVTMGSR